MKTDSAGRAKAYGHSYPSRKSDVARISLQFGSFRPSERKEVEVLMETSSGMDVVAEAVAMHLDGWTGAGWLDRPHVERLGHWFAKKAPTDVRHKLQHMVGSGSEPAYSAFLAGMRKEASGAFATEPVETSIAKAS